MSEQNNWENKTSGKSESLWFANIRPIKFTKLTRNISTKERKIGRAYVQRILLINAFRDETLFQQLLDSLLGH
jgi:hypothetical protein